MNNPVRPDPDTLYAFWRCLEETRAAIDVRERPARRFVLLVADIWLLMQYHKFSVSIGSLDEHTINVGYLREYRGDVFGAN